MLKKSENFSTSANYSLEYHGAKEFIVLEEN